jgi:hypothetical protein
MKLEICSPATEPLQPTGVPIMVRDIAFATRPETIYDPKVHTSTQAIAEKVLITMSQNRMPKSLEIANLSKLRDEEIPWIPWTTETLLIVLQLWDSHTSLPKLNEVCDVLVASGLIIQRDDPPSHHELTTTGRAEVERLGN